MKVPSRLLSKQMRSRLTAGGEAFETRTVHEKNVEPAIVVVVVERNSATGCFEQIFVLVFAAEDRLGIQAGFAPHVEEGDSEIVARRRNFFRGFRFLRCRRRNRAGRAKARTFSNERTSAESAE